MTPGTPSGAGPEEQRYYRAQDRVWRRLAPFYAAAIRPFRRLRRVVAERVGAGPGMRILDVATGTGEQALAFAEAGGDVVGVDLSPAMLEVARRNVPLPNASFQLADAAALPFGDGAFDLAGISFALHEMPPSVRERAVRELARVTRADGVVLVVDYGLPRRRPGRTLVPRIVSLWEPDAYREFVRSDLAGLLGRAGVEVTTDELALGGLARLVIGRRTSPPET